MQTKMLHTHGTCPYCGTKIFPYAAEEWLYGSPIRTCKKCSKNYVDNRYHEIAVEGIAPNTLSAKRNIIGIFIFLGIFLIAFLIHYYEMHFQNYYHPLYYGIMGIAAVGIIIMIVDLIRIISGAKAKKLEKLRGESVKRLQDKNYAQELFSIGYCIPEEYFSDSN